MQCLLDSVRCGCGCVQTAMSMGSTTHLSRRWPLSTRQCKEAVWRYWRWVAEGRVPPIWVFTIAETRTKEV